MKYKLKKVNNKRVCKYNYYNNKYYTNDINIIKNNCSGIFYLKNYTIAIKVAFDNLYRWLFNARVNSKQNYNSYVLCHFRQMQNYLNKYQKDIISKNKKYYKIYFLVNDK